MTAKVERNNATDDCEQQSSWLRSFRDYLTWLTLAPGAIQWILARTSDARFWWLAATASWLLAIPGIYLAILEIRRRRTILSKIELAEPTNAPFHSTEKRIQLILGIIVGVVACLLFTYLATSEYEHALGHIEDVQILPGGTNVAIYDENDIARNVVARATITDVKTATSEWIGDAHVIQFTIFPRTTDGAVTLSEIRVVIDAFAAIPNYKPISGIFPQGKSVYWVDIDDPAKGSNKFRATWLVEDSYKEDRTRKFAPIILGEKGASAPMPVLVRVNAKTPGLYSFHLEVDLQTAGARRTIKLRETSLGGLKFDCIYEMPNIVTPESSSREVN